MSIKGIFLSEMKEKLKATHIKKKKNSEFRMIDLQQKKKKKDFTGIRPDIKYITHTYTK